VERLAVGVVGVGHLGKQHARVYSELPGVELVGVADINAERAREAAQRTGCRAFADHRDLIGQVEAVSVAVPTVTHYEIGRDFIAHDCAVMVEKPMTQSLEEAHDLNRLAREKDVILQVGHIERFNPAMMALDSLGIVPKFIEVQRLRPFSFRSADIGVVMDLMIHDIDIILHLANSEVRKIDACGVAAIGKHEDLANARITFANGCVANVTASRVAIKSVRKFRVFSEDSYISLDYDAKQGYIFKKSPKFNLLESIDFSKVDAKDLADLKGYKFDDFLTIRQIPIDDHEPLFKELESFVTCVREHKSPIVTGEHGARAIDTAQQIVRAIRQHDWYGRS